MPISALIARGFGFNNGISYIVTLGLGSGSVVSGTYLPLIVVGSVIISPLTVIRMAYKPGDAYYKEVTTSNPSTGAAQNVDTGVPTAIANHNGVDNSSAFPLTVTNLDTGRYKIVGIVPDSYISGDTVNITVTATVNGVIGKGVVDSFVIDTKRVSDLNDIPATAIVSSGPITTLGGNIFLAAKGLDAVTVEVGVNARQAMALILDALVGALTGGASSVNIVYDPTGQHPRAVITVDISGDRSNISLSPPA